MIVKASTFVYIAITKRARALCLIKVKEKRRELYIVKGMFIVCFIEG